jgi:tRNA-splicing ligase RtcB
MTPPLYTTTKISELEYRIEPDASYGMKVPVVIYANKNLLQKMISDRTIEQAVNVSTLPGVLKQVVVLPDGHQGYGFPVGGVAGMDIDEGVISPGSVGYDINCGVRLIRTNLTEKEIMPKLTDLVDHLFNSIPAGLNPKGGCVKLNTTQLDEVLVQGVKWLETNGYATKDDLDVCEENGCIQNADPNKVSDLARSRGTPQVGSLGSGNHFLEIQRVQEIHDEEVAKVMGIFPGQITILIHCGSRGLGHQVCTDYLKICEASHQKYGIELPDKQLACAPNTSEEGISYKQAMNAAMNFAWSNRQMITHYTRKSFEFVLNRSESDLEMNLIYDVAHNIAKVEKHKIDGQEKSIIVHRKGATRAFPAGNTEIPKKYQKIGQPVFVPGSMGSASWILLGNKNSLNLTFGSTVHGAGRVMSRTQSHKNYNYKQIIEEIQAKGIVLKSMTRYGVVEEAPEVYKDVDTIANISHDLKLATKVAKLVPIGVIKG